jgi:hypothetical protein
MPSGIGLECPVCHTDNLQFRERGSFLGGVLSCLECGNYVRVAPTYTRADFGKALKVQTDKRLAKKWGVTQNAAHRR